MQTFKGLSLFSDCILKNFMKKLKNILYYI